MPSDPLDVTRTLELLTDPPYLMEHVLDSILRDKDDDKRVEILVARGLQSLRHLVCATDARQIRAAHIIFTAEMDELYKTKPVTKSSQEARMLFLRLAHSFIDMVNIIPSPEAQRDFLPRLLDKYGDHMWRWKAGIRGIVPTTAWWTRFDTSLPQQLIITAPPWAFIPDASVLSTLPAPAPINSVTPQDALYIAPPGLSEPAPNSTQPPTASFSTSTSRIQDVPSASSHTSATGPAVSDRTARPSTNSLDRSSTLPPRLRRDNVAQTRDPVMNASSLNYHPGAASVRSLPGHDHRQDAASEPFPPYNAHEINTNARFDRLDDGMRTLQLLIAASCVAQGRQWSIFVPELFNRLSSLTRQIRALEVAVTGEQVNSGGS